MDVPRRGDQQPETADTGAGRERNNWSLLLLLIPFIALLYPPFYAGITPKLGAVPYFIWYQFLWVLIGAAITALVYKLRG